MAAMYQWDLSVQPIVSLLHAFVCITLGSVLNHATQAVSDISEIQLSHGMI